ncbi:outer membrane receptor protein [Hydrogenophaga taeniospiralis CCUG 15921]|uniref:Outer membrane receptor protein n=1 Tax=Hydrogenophaga taeniospiralis CCUG 15921 TaxID=1281780 RepID=A0A9X4S7J6_9BURK|nr:outer membrane receptor protein [Hydrogenophaga taeniospiralis CCUG 15921]
MRPEGPRAASGRGSWGEAPQRSALAVEQGVEPDRAEGGGADAAEREFAEAQRVVAGAEHQGDGGHEQVLVVREVDLVVDPDLGAGHGNQAKHHDGHAAHHGQRNGLDQRAELGTEAEQDRHAAGHEKDGGGVDLGRGHDADVFGVGGHAGAARAAGHDGGHAVAHEGAAHVAVQVLAGHRRHGLDVAQVLRHQDDGHGRDQQHGVAAEHRRAEIGQAEPGGAGDAAQVQRFAQTEAVGEHGVDDAGDDQAHEDQQALQHAAAEHGHQRHTDEGHALHPGVEARGRHVLDRDAGQVQADHRHHRAGDHRRHQAFDPARADGLHQRADQRVDDAAGDDAAERHADVGVGPRSGVAAGRDHHADEGEAGAEVARHLAAGHDEEDQRADAAHEDGDVGVEAHQDGGEHGGAEHGDQVLHAHHGRLRPGQALVGADDAAVRERGR